MFYCDECREKKNWPESLSMSIVPCEICGNMRSCWNVKTSNLPKDKSNQQKDIKIKESAHQLIQKKLKETGLRKKWFAKNNFIYIFTGEGLAEITEEPISMCNSNIVALHIACAHNAVLESAL